MSSTCNIVQQIKVSELVKYSSLKAKDLILTIESGSSNDLYSRKSTFGDVVNFLKTITGSYTGSFSGSLHGKAYINGILTGSFKGNATGSFIGKHTGSFTGSFNGYTIGKTKTSGSLSGSYYGSVLSKNSNLSGSLSGSYYGSIISKNTNSTGSFNGNFGGILKGKFSGSATGSFIGYISASSHFNSNRKVAFYGTASNAITASYVLGYAGSVAGSGTTNQFTYWTNTSTLGSTNYLTRNSSINNLGSMPSGRISINNPLQFSTLGEQIIQYSGSGGESIYGFGLQSSNNYLRTTSNFSIYYSGSHINTSDLPEKDVIWQAGKSGFGVLGIRQRLLSVGNIVSSDNVNAQLHVHLSGSTGWPTSYNPNTNVLLITSGSAQTKLLRVSGSGQLDVRGDIVALSTFASSDERLKSNIKPIENALVKINEINPVEFNWKSNGKQDFGIIAQEIERLYPDFVNENIDGYKVVKYNPLIALLIKSVQELQQEVNELKNKLK